jgi:hypothetical protein
MTDYSDYLLQIAINNIVASGVAQPLNYQPPDVQYYSSSQLMLRKGRYFCGGARWRGQPEGTAAYRKYTTTVPWTMSAVGKIRNALYAHQYGSIMTCEAAHFHIVDFEE